MLRIILPILLTVCCNKSTIKINFYNKGINENFIKFCKDGDKNKVIKLLDEDIDVNVKNQENKAPIHYATMYGWEDVTRALIEKGANIYIKDKEDQSPLSYAILFENNRVIKLLIANGADINFKDNEGNTPLMSAIIRNKETLAKLLIKSGASVTDKANNMKTALIYAIEEGYVEIIQMILMKDDESELRYKEEIDKLTKERYDINFRDGGGNISLIIASSKGELEIVKTLLEKGADVNSKNNNGISSLMVSSRLGYKKIVKLLIEKGANINDKDINNYTALIHTFDNVQLDSKLTEVIKILIEKGCDYNNSSNTQSLILFYASKHQNLEIMEILSKKGMDIASYGGRALVNALVKGDFL